MFIHRPLSQSNREIRLVRILGCESCTPSPASSSPEKISLQLRHASLNDDSIEYTAVSYTWNSSNSSSASHSSSAKEISIDGLPFPVRINLHDALLQFRRDGVGSWLWIDAICIRQADDAEKAWQLMEMRHVFGRARVVYLWLGRGCAESDLAMNFVARVGPRAVGCNAARLAMYGDEEGRELLAGVAAVVRAREDARGGGVGVVGSGLDEFLYDLLSENDLSPEHGRESALIDGLKNILVRDYWHRVWIIQEVALAKEAVVVVGGKRVPLDIFDAVFVAIWHGRRLGLRYLRPEWRRFGWHLGGTLYDIKSLDIRRQLRYKSAAAAATQETTSVRLLNILWDNGSAAFRPHYTATDPRDIFFGLLGILPRQERHNIRADYTKTFVDVFTEVTRELISDGDEGRHCFQLDYCMPGEADGPLPTWVPDWRQIGMDGVQTWNVSNGQFRAAGGLLQPVSSGVGAGRVLNRFGCRIDVVTEVMRPPRWVQTHAGFPSSIEDADAWCRDICRFMRLGPESGAAEDYIWRTVAFGNVEQTVLSPDGEDPNRCMGLRRSMMRVRRLRAASLTEEEATFVRSTPLFRNMGFDPRLSELGDEVLGVVAHRWREYTGSVARNRTLFKTSKGMLGLGRVGVDEGDVVTLMWGVQAPIVLRERGGGAEGFYFRGDAYVDGIMMGEFLRTGPAQEEFCIH